MMEFDFFYASEADQFTFYRIPKMLFTEERFFNVSIEAKVLYGLLLDRMALSRKNGWIDEDGRVYIYFTLEEVLDFMKIGKDKGVKLFAELDSDKGCGLILRKRQGLGKATIIYVRNFNSFIDSVNKSDGNNAEEIDEIQTSEKPKSGLLDSAEVLTSEIPKSALPEKPNSGLLKNRSLEVGKSEANNTELNNNKNNNTEFSDINPIISNQSDHNRAEMPKSDVMDEMDKRRQYRELILENIEYEILLERNYAKEEIDGLVDIMLDLVCNNKDYVSINGADMPKEVVKSRMLKIGFEHIEYVMDCLRKNTTKVRNIKSYLTTSLYNAPTTIGSYYTAEVNHDLYGAGRENLL